MCRFAIFLLIFLCFSATLYKFFFYDGGVKWLVMTVAHERLENDSKTFNMWTIYGYCKQQIVNWNFLVCKKGDLIKHRKWKSFYFTYFHPRGMQQTVKGFYRMKKLNSEICLNKKLCRQEISSCYAKLCGNDENLTENNLIKNFHYVLLYKSFNITTWPIILKITSQPLQRPFFR